MKRKIQQLNLFDSVPLAVEDKLIHDFELHTYNDKHEVIFNFGTNAGKRVIDKRDYASWMLSQNFPLDTKRKLKSILYSKP